jgi:hypothetical protein
VSSVQVYGFKSKTTYCLDEFRWKKANSFDSSSKLLDWFGESTYTFTDWAGFSLDLVLF